MDITVVIPTINRRYALRERALESVRRQTLAPAAVLVERDSRGRGAPETRQRGLDRVETPWVAFLDDDDEFRPQHLQRLSETAIETGADMVFSWFDVIGGQDPFPHLFGKVWDRENPTHTTVTTLVRTALAREVGGFRVDVDLATAPRTDEDWEFTLRINAAGKIVHLPERTWLWHHHSSNTSGLPRR